MANTSWTKQDLVDLKQVVVQFNNEDLSTYYESVEGNLDFVTRLLNHNCQMGEISSFDNEIYVNIRTFFTNFRHECFARSVLNYFINDKKFVRFTSNSNNENTFLDMMIELNSMELLSKRMETLDITNVLQSLEFKKPVPEKYRNKTKIRLSSVVKLTPDCILLDTANNIIHVIDWKSVKNNETVSLTLEKYSMAVQKILETQLIPDSIKFVVSIVNFSPLDKLVHLFPEQNVDMFGFDLVSELNSKMAVEDMPDLIASITSAVDIVTQQGFLHNKEEEDEDLTNFSLADCCGNTAIVIKLMESLNDSNRLLFVLNLFNSHNMNTTVKEMEFASTKDFFKTLYRKFQILRDFANCLSKYPNVSGYLSDCDKFYMYLSEPDLLQPIITVLLRGINGQDYIMAADWNTDLKQFLQHLIKIGSVDLQDMEKWIIDQVLIKNEQNLLLETTIKSKEIKTGKTKITTKYIRDYYRLMVQKYIEEDKTFKDCDKYDSKDNLPFPFMPADEESYVQGITVQKIITSFFDSMLANLNIANSAVMVDKIEDCTPTDSWVLKPNVPKGFPRDQHMRLLKLATNIRDLSDLAESYEEVKNEDLNILNNPENSAKQDSKFNQLEIRKMKRYQMCNEKLLHDSDCIFIKDMLHSASKKSIKSNESYKPEKFIKEDIHGNLIDVSKTNRRDLSTMAFKSKHNKKKIVNERIYESTANEWASKLSEEYNKTMVNTSIFNDQLMTNFKNQIPSMNVADDSKDKLGNIIDKTRSLNGYHNADCITNLSKGLSITSKTAMNGLRILTTKNKNMICLTMPGSGDRRNDANVPYICIAKIKKEDWSNFSKINYKEIFYVLGNPVSNKVFCFMKPKRYSVNRFVNLVKTKESVLMNTMDRLDNQSVIPFLLSQTVRMTRIGYIEPLKLLKGLCLAEGSNLEKMVEEKMEPCVDSIADVYIFNTFYKCMEELQDLDNDFSVRNQEIDTETESIIQTGVTLNRDVTNPMTGLKTKELIEIWNSYAMPLYAMPKGYQNPVANQINITQVPYEIEKKLQDLHYLLKENNEFRFIAELTQISYTSDYYYACNYNYFRILHHFNAIKGSNRILRNNLADKEGINDSMITIPTFSSPRSTFQVNHVNLDALLCHNEVTMPHVYRDVMRIIKNSPALSGMTQSGLLSKSKKIKLQQTPEMLLNNRLESFANIVKQSDGFKKMVKNHEETEIFINNVKLAFERFELDTFEKLCYEKLLSFCKMPILLNHKVDAETTWRSFDLNKFDVQNANYKEVLEIVGFDIQLLKSIVELSDLDKLDIPKQWAFVIRKQHKYHVDNDIKPSNVPDELWQNIKKVSLKKANMKTIMKGNVASIQKKSVISILEGHNIKTVTVKKMNVKAAVLEYLENMGFSNEEDPLFSNVFKKIDIESPHIMVEFPKGQRSNPDREIYISDINTRVLLFTMERVAKVYALQNPNEMITVGGDRKTVNIQTMVNQTKSVYNQMVKQVDGNREMFDKNALRSFATKFNKFEVSKKTKKDQQSLNKQFMETNIQKFVDPIYEVNFETEVLNAQIGFASIDNSKWSAYCNSSQYLYVVACMGLLSTWEKIRIINGFSRYITKKYVAVEPSILFKLISQKKRSELTGEEFFYDGTLVDLINEEKNDIKTNLIRTSSNWLQGNLNYFSSLVHTIVMNNLENIFAKSIRRCGFKLVDLFYTHSEHSDDAAAAFSLITNCSRQNLYQIFLSALKINSRIFGITTNDKKTHISSTRLEMVSQENISGEAIPIVAPHLAAITGDTAYSGYANDILARGSQISALALKGSKPSITVLAQMAAYSCTLNLYNMYPGQRNSIERQNCFMPRNLMPLSLGGTRLVEPVLVAYYGTGASDYCNFVDLLHFFSNINQNVAQILKGNDDWSQISAQLVNYANVRNFSLEFDVDSENDAIIRKQIEKEGIKLRGRNNDKYVNYVLRCLNFWINYITQSLIASELTSDYSKKTLQLVKFPVMYDRKMLENDKYYQQCREENISLRHFGNVTFSTLLKPASTIGEQKLKTLLNMLDEGLAKQQAILSGQQAYVNMCIAANSAVFKKFNPATKVDGELSYEFYDNVKNLTETNRRYLLSDLIKDILDYCNKDHLHKNLPRDANIIDLSVFYRSNKTLFFMCNVIHKSVFEKTDQQSKSFTVRLLNKFKDESLFHSRVDRYLANVYDRPTLEATNTTWLLDDSSMENNNRVYNMAISKWKFCTEIDEYQKSIKENIDDDNLIELARNFKILKASIRMLESQLSPENKKTNFYYSKHKTLNDPRNNFLNLLSQNYSEEIGSYRPTISMSYYLSHLFNDYIYQKGRIGLHSSANIASELLTVIDKFAPGMFSYEEMLKHFDTTYIAPSQFIANNDASSYNFSDINLTTAIKQEYLLHKYSDTSYIIDNFPVLRIVYQNESNELNFLVKTLVNMNNEPDNVKSFWLEPQKHLNGRWFGSFKLLLIHEKMSIILSADEKGFINKCTIHDSRMINFRKNERLNVKTAVWKHVLNTSNPEIFRMKMNSLGYSSLRYETARSIYRSANNILRNFQKNFKNIDENINSKPLPNTYSDTTMYLFSTTDKTGTFDYYNISDTYVVNSFRICPVEIAGPVLQEVLNDRTTSLPEDYLTNNNMKIWKLDNVPLIVNMFRSKIVQMGNNKEVGLIGMAYQKIKRLPLSGSGVYIKNVDKHSGLVVNGIVLNKFLIDSSLRSGDYKFDSFTGLVNICDLLVEYNLYSKTKSYKHYIKFDDEELDILQESQINYLFKFNNNAVLLSHAENTEQLDYAIINDDRTSGKLAIQLNYFQKTLSAEDIKKSDSRFYVNYIDRDNVNKFKVNNNSAINLLKINKTLSNVIIEKNNSFRNIYLINKDVAMMPEEEFDLLFYDALLDINQIRVTKLICNDYMSNNIDSIEEMNDNPFTPFWDLESDLTDEIEDQIKIEDWRIKNISIMASNSWYFDFHSRTDILTGKRFAQYNDEDDGMKEIELKVNLKQANLGLLCLDELSFFEMVKSMLMKSEDRRRSLKTKIDREKSSSLRSIFMRTYLKKTVDNKVKEVVFDSDRRIPENLSSADRKFDELFELPDSDNSDDGNDDNDNWY